MLGRKGKTWLIGLVAGVVLYTITGFLIAPRAIKLWIESPNVSGPTCRLRVQQVYVNPFTMFLSFENVTLFGQENKVFVSATRAETKLWTVGMFQGEGPGRDIAVRDLIVRSADSDETMLAVPRAFVQSVTAGVGDNFIDATFARLEQPDATIVRDATGLIRRPAWLSVPGGERSAACISSCTTSPPRHAETPAGVRHRQRSTSKLEWVQQAPSASKHNWATPPGTTPTCSR